MARTTGAICRTRRHNKPLSLPPRSLRYRPDCGASCKRPGEAWMGAMQHGSCIETESATSAAQNPLNTQILQTFTLIAFRRLHGCVAILSFGPSRSKTDFKGVSFRTKDPLLSPAEEARFRTSAIIQKAGLIVNPAQPDTAPVNPKNDSSRA